jgi:hypothetical protein
VKVVRRSNLLSLCALASSLPAAAGDSLSDIVFIEPVRIAFYELAPRSIAASMRRTVKDACAAHAQPDWLCGGGPLSFFRGVNVLGNHYTTGFVCEGERGGNVKYYMEDTFSDDSCLYLCYDGKKKRHFFQVPAEPAKDDAPNQ